MFNPEGGQDTSVLTLIARHSTHLRREIENSRRKATCFNHQWQTTWQLQCKSGGLFPESFKCFSLLFPPYRKCCLLLQDCRLVYSILRSRIKGRWSQIAVNAQKQVQKMILSSQITDMLFSALITMHWGAVCISWGQEAMRLEKGGGGEEKGKEMEGTSRTL